MDDLPEILTAEDIRSYLRYDSITTVYELFRRGQIKPIGVRNGRKTNRLWRATKKAFMEFLDGAE